MLSFLSLHTFRNVSLNQSMITSHTWKLQKNTPPQAYGKANSSSIAGFPWHLSWGRHYTATEMSPCVGFPQKGTELSFIPFWSALYPQESLLLPERLQADVDWNQLPRISAVTSILKVRPVLSRSCTRLQAHTMATKFKCTCSKPSLTQRKKMWGGRKKIAAS